MAPHAVDTRSSTYVNLGADTLKVAGKLGNNSLGEGIRQEIRPWLRSGTKCSSVLGKRAVSRA